ncbi:MAG: trypsin-like peptidase domain-containing protein, partial [Oscillospiraceae bacterium]|nr:trypsin-like peptidase domain-containing protein [Oscillospiraceae bacterium]
SYSGYPGYPDHLGVPPQGGYPGYPGYPNHPGVPPQGGYPGYTGYPGCYYQVPQYHPQTPPPPSPPPVPPVKVATMNKRVYTMAAVLAVLVFLLCVYCIGSDILHGALGSDERSVINVTVELQTQQKPELDPADENVTADGEYTVRGVAELVRPSIVEVYTYSDSERIVRNLAGTGSGIVISEDGYIITNAHVVDGVAFKVILDDEEEYDAELIGSDSKTDLAVLKINAHDLTAAVLGDSDETYVGENVVAIGNPAGLTNTVTKGIVSAIGRQVRAESNSFRMECIQTDAAISPGNSGGALVNMYGQVIGITSSKYASAYSGVYEGLGFAITINEALPVITDLMEEGYVSGRFRIGITFTSTMSDVIAEEFQNQYGQELPEELSSALWITEISDDSSVAETELQPNDFIVEMQGEPVGDYDEVLEVLDGCKGGDTVTARCARVEDDG